MTAAEAADDPRPVRTPGTEALGPLVGRFDDAVDDALERLRGHRLPDTVFTLASTLGDFSVIWHIVNISRGLTSPRRRRQIPLLALGLGVESLAVNQGLKRLVGRPRPTLEGDPRFDVRRPSTSSFPSGHASASGFTATLLTGWDGWRVAPLWWALGGTVATSRAYVRIHHASDVVAGLAVGVGFGLATHRLLRRLGRG